MNYATVVTTNQDIDNPIPHGYLISPANEAGEPEEGMLGKFGRVLFAAGEGRYGCNEVDLLGVVMHRLAAVAQDGEHRHYERALQCLDAAMLHLTAQSGESIEAPEVVCDLSHLASETLQ